MQRELILPSDALNRNFQLPGDDAEQEAANSVAVRKIRAHAFLLDQFGMLLDTEDTVAEIFDELPVCRLPNTASWLYGIANQRSNIVPIFDLRDYLGFEPCNDEAKQRFLVIEQKQGSIGILVEELPTRVVLTEDDLMTEIPSLPGGLQPYVQACYKDKGRTWLDWDVASFFNDLSKQVSL